MKSKKSVRTCKSKKGVHLCVFVPLREPILMKCPACKPAGMSDVYVWGAALCMDLSVCVYRVKVCTLVSDPAEPEVRASDKWAIYHRVQSANQAPNPSAKRTVYLADVAQTFTRVKQARRRMEECLICKNGPGEHRLVIRKRSWPPWKCSAI